jgi:hypothetical protein
MNQKGILPFWFLVVWGGSPIDTNDEPKGETSYMKSRDNPKFFEAE